MTSGIGVPSTAVRVNVNLPVISPAFSPSGTSRIFSTGISAVVGLTSYVFVNTTEPSSVAYLMLWLSVPSPLSVMITVNVLPFAASASFVTPLTFPSSITLYSYSPGALNVIEPKLTVPPSAAGFLTVSPPCAGIGAPSVTAESVNVYFSLISGSARPSCAPTRVLRTAGVALIVPTE